MAFTKALYYPWIDIRNEGWLKNALLYWESIQTIVPNSIDKPYSTRAALEFCDEGLLVPLHVESNMQEIKDLADEVIKYLETPEGAEVLMSKEISNYHYIHPDKLPLEIRELVDIHPQKLPYEIRHKLEWGLSHAQRDGWIAVDARFADFYMTLLATRLSEEIGAGLLTDTAANNKLANAVKLDAKLSIPSSQRRGYDFDDDRRHRDMPFAIAQGTLSDLILEKIQIDPDTSTKDILKFRKDHSDELGRFRTRIAELTKVISNDQPLEALRQQVEDVYTNEVKPAISALEKSLTDHRIKWVAENFLKVSFFSTSSTSVPLVLLGLGVPHALLVGVGVSLIASAIIYNREKADKLRQNPFSYLLAAERTFH
jgi:hypothetical protein